MIISKFKGRFTHHRSGRLAQLFLFLALTAGPTIASAQPGQTNQATRLADLTAEMNTAMDKVKVIINQPVPKYARTRGMAVSEFSPGWFHDGAVKPAFAAVDVRKTQDLTAYAKNKYVTSDLNPGVVFPSDQIEFNAMTKYFYTDRSLPKKRLTEAEMLEINRLYRIIGRCERELDEIQYPPTTQGEPEADPEPEGRLARIPKGNFVKAGIGIAVVLLLYIGYRFLR